MKKIFLNIALLLPLSLLVFSCHDDDYDYDDIEINALAIDSVSANSDTMQVYSVQSIRTYSTYYGGCDRFYGYDYQYTNDSVRTVIAYHYITDETCTSDAVPVAKYSQFNFQPRYTGTYTFKFWNGTDSNGDDVWLTKEIVVE